MEVQHLRINKGILEKLPWEIRVEVAENLFRKDLTESEKARLQERIMSFLSPLNQQGRRTDLEETSSKLLEEVDHGTLGRVAKMFDESHETVRRRRFVYRAAQKEEGCAEILKKLDKGALSLSESYNRARRALHRKEMSIDAQKIELPEHVSLICKRFQDSTEPDESVDLIFSDPPYAAEALPVYADLAKLAMRVLKPGGSMVVYAGHHMLFEIGDVLRAAGLKPWWVFALWHQGASGAVYGRQVIVRWKPLLHFIKGDKPACMEFISDRLDMTRPPDKLAHEWQQGIEEAKYVIEHLTYPNQVVADYTAGSGTTGIAALSAGRHFVGYEVDPTHFAVMQSRIGKYLIA